MQSKRILIVDDEASLRTALFRALDRRGYQVITSASYKEAETIGATDKALDLALVDLRLPDGDGIELMSKLKSVHPNIQVIILTGHASIEIAVEATRKGAFHFVTKPCNLDEIMTLVDRALSHSQLTQENQHLRNALHKKYQFENIIGQSEQITEVLSMIERVAQSDSTVLIMGESGTGKELVAKALHYNSTRHQEAFIPINCGAIPAELLESELFGHVKGAFTGAIANRVGRFEMADDGTLFLDEIGDMSANLQVKLLRVLQEGTFTPVGALEMKKVDVRIVAATNRNLREMVEDGSFREDLYYRLNVINLRVPPLRERKEDIPLLSEFFIEHACKKSGQPKKILTKRALEKLYDYAFPGNVRELQNEMERLVVLSGSEQKLIVEMLSPKILESNEASKVQGARIAGSLKDAIEDLEKDLIKEGLRRTGWNKSKLAKELGISRAGLIMKVEKYGLDKRRIAGLAGGTK